MRGLQKGDRVEISWPRGEGQWRGWIEAFDEPPGPPTGPPPPGYAYRSITVTVKMDPNHRLVDDDYMDWDICWIRKLSVLELIAEAADAPESR